MARGKRRELTAEPKAAHQELAEAIRATWPEEAVMSKVLTTSCPRNCYSTCTMRVEVEGGRVRRIAPHAGNRATPEGVCLKGLSYVERAISPDRLLRPLRRRGDRFEPVGWDEALDEIAERFGAARDERGPQSVLYYAASGTKGLLNGVGAAFWRHFGGYTTTYGDLCWPAGLEATRLTLGEIEHNAPWDIENARLIVMWGKNPAETNIHQVTFLERARAAGAQLVVIDPRRTQTAERADLLLQPHPGTDGALALAVAHRVIAAGHVDEAFVREHVQGYEAFADRVRGWTPALAAEICGVPTEAIERLAELVGTVTPATICAGYGMQRYTNSGQAMRAMIALLALTGNVGRPGAGWVFANLQSGIFDEVKDPVAFFPPAEPDGVARVSISTARLGEEMLATRDPGLRVAWIERGNPVAQNPDTNTTLRALRSLDFRVVVDQFLTDTAREADLVLPAKSLFEQSDVIGAYWHAYVQLKQKVLEPPGEVRPETEIYRGLIGRLDIEDPTLGGALPGPTDAEVDAWLESRLAPFDGLSLERLREGPVPAPGAKEVAYQDLAFATPSGKIELRSKEAAERWGVDELPHYSEPVESTRRPSREAERFPLQLLTPNTKNRIHSQFGNLEMIRRLDERAFVHVHPDDATGRGLADGADARVFNDRGELRLPVRHDATLRRGCVSITNGWWSEQGGTPNALSLGRETDLGHGAAFHDALVELAPVDDAT